MTYWDVANWHNWVLGVSCWASKQLCTSPRMSFVCGCEDCISFAAQFIGRTWPAKVASAGRPLQDYTHITYRILRMDSDLRIGLLTVSGAHAI